MSMWTDYIKEREGKEAVETEYGFATYEFAEDFCYIIDIYTKPEFRRDKKGLEIADKITEIAKARGCKRLIGSINTNGKGVTGSMKALLWYGFEFTYVDGFMIYFTKEI